MKTILRYAGQVAIYAAIAAVIGYFANAPAYAPVAEDKAQIKLSFTHGGKNKGGCRDLTAEELAELAPNMRKARVCSSERLPVTIELEADGEILYTDTLQPIGLRSDGPSQTFRRFVVEPGRHVIVARLRDSDRATGFDHETEHVVDLRAGQNLAIDFGATERQFIFE